MYESCFVASAPFVGRGRIFFQLVKRGCKIFNQCFLMLLDELLEFPDCESFILAVGKSCLFTESKSFVRSLILIVDISCKVLAERADLFVSYSSFR